MQTQASHDSRRRDVYAAREHLNALQAVETLHRNLVEQVVSIRDHAESEKVRSEIADYLDYLTNTYHDTLGAALTVAKGRLADAGGM